MSTPSLLFLDHLGSHRNRLGPVPPTVSAGEYALREPSHDRDHSLVNVLSSFDNDASADDGETVVEASTFGVFELDVWLGSEIAIASQVEIDSAINPDSLSRIDSLLRVWQGFIDAQIINRSAMSRALDRLCGGHLQRRASYLLSYGVRASTLSLTKDFLLNTWRELVENQRDLAEQRALLRTLRIVVRWVTGPGTETGSAAAIAKRMNPLGAPPQFV